MQLASTSPSLRLRHFLSLTKPRVVSLIVFCAVIGMFLATPGMVPPGLLLAATLGIWLVAGAAAAVNCLVEQKIDAVMTRTSRRPLPRGELNSLQTLAFAGVVGGMGLSILYTFVNPLTMWLTFGTFIGYAVVYTVLLKPVTPQNIVIGGASGAMPPVLGWAAVTGEVTPEALLLFLIIFAWTPPHFWALALYRTEDFARAGPAHAACHPRPSLYAAVRSALYLDTSRVRAFAFCLRHERVDLSHRGAHPQRRVCHLCGALIRKLQRRAGEAYFPLFDLRISRCFSPRSWSTTILENVSCESCPVSPLLH